MQLDDAEVQEFIDLWRDEFRETLPKEQARHVASQLVRLYAMLANTEVRPSSAGEEPVSRS